MLKELLKLGGVFLLVLPIVGLTPWKLANAIYHEAYDHPLLALVLGLAGVVAYVIVRVNENQRISIWAQDNGYEVIKAERCDLFDTPLTFRNIWGVVFLVQLRDRAGNRTDAWVNLGAGAASRITVTWKQNSGGEGLE